MKTYRDLPGDGGSGILEQVLDQRRKVAESLSAVRHVVAVMSGKGGVGKSTISAALASALAARGDSVAVLDADVNGPSVPRLFGLHGQRARLEPDGLEAPQTPAGIAVMSTDLFLRGDDEPLRYEGPADDAYTWRPTAEISTLREMLANTRWGARDWLVVDLPPGSERLPDVLTILPRLAGAVVVTLGSALSLRIVAKSVTVAKDRRVAIAGLVENMAGLPCPSCGTLAPLFGEPGAGERAAARLGIPFLGAVPHDHGLALAIDRGGPVDFVAQAGPQFREALRSIADRVAAHASTSQSAGAAP